MIEQLRFYMCVASPELLESRREYIERVIVGKLKEGIESMGKWSPALSSLPDSTELIAAYRAGLAFFTEKGFNGQVDAQEEAKP